MHAMECYSVIKWNAVMLLARKLKELKITSLSEVKLTKTSVVCFPSCVKSRTKEKNMEVEGGLTGLWIGKRKGEEGGGGRLGRTIKRMDLTTKVQHVHVVWKYHKHLTN